ncbi:MAG: hypothetical protein IJT21_08670 [Synergistaceae bacterium]|nr:hypothetical protein [Synergistaceae bacterium]
MLFAKKVTIYKKKDKATWQKIKDVLKSSGIKGVKAGHYAIDSLSVCGCGSKLDPRNFGTNGKIDRDVYYIDVREEDLTRAQEIISQNGINAEIINDVWGKFGRV